MGIITKMRDSWACSKAKRDHRRKFPYCVVTGSKGSLLAPNEVHHVISVDARPDLACDPGNLRTVTKAVHRWVGHPEGFSSYNTRFDETVFALRGTLRANVVNSK